LFLSIVPVESIETPASVTGFLTIIPAVLVVGTALLFLLHLLPRGLANVAGPKAMTLVSPSVAFLHFLAFPVRVPLTKATDLILTLFRAQHSTQDPFSPPGEALESVQIPPESPLIPDENRRMIQEILLFEDKQVKEILVPRTDMVFLRQDALLRNAQETFRSSRHSRIPVVGNTVDTVLGIIYARDIVPYLESDDMEKPVTTVLRPTIYVPDTKRIGELMTEMQRSHIQIAIAIDEYGGTAGIVTMEDIIQESVGAIHDEYDVPDRQILPVSPKTYIVDAGMDLDELNIEIGVSLPTHENETLGGFIMELMGRIPDSMEQVTYDGMTFTVTDMEENRIRKVRIEIGVSSEEEMAKEGGSG